MRRCVVTVMALLLAGCAPDPSKDVPKAKVEDPAPKAQPKAPAEEPDKAETPKKADPAPAKPDPGKTSSIAVEPKPTTPGHVILGGSVSFVGSKVTSAHECIFRSWKGTAIEGGTDGQWAIKVEIDVNSLFCDPKERTEYTPKFEAHLRNEDFFHVEKYPKATFETTEVRAELEGENTHVLKGDLTIRGKTRTVSFPARLQLGPKRVSGKAEFTINRKDFGIVYPGKPDNLIRDGVVLKLQLSGTRG